MPVFEFFVCSAGKDTKKKKKKLIADYEFTAAP